MFHATPNHSLAIINYSVRCSFCPSPFILDQTHFLAHWHKLSMCSHLIHQMQSKHDLLICIGSTIFIWHLKVLVISVVLHDSSVKYRRASTKSLYIHTHTQSYLRVLVEHVNGIGHLETQKMDFVVVCNVFSY